MFYAYLLNLVCSLTISDEERIEIVDVLSDYREGIDSDLSKITELYYQILSPEKADDRLFSLLKQIPEHASGKFVSLRVFWELIAFSQGHPTTHINIGTLVFLLAMGKSKNPESAVILLAVLDPVSKIDAGNHLHCFQELQLAA